MKVKKVFAVFLLSIIFPNFASAAEPEKQTNSAAEEQNSISANQKVKTQVVRYLTGKSRTVTLPTRPACIATRYAVDFRKASSCKLEVKMFHKRVNGVEKRVIGLFRKNELDPYALCALARKLKYFPDLSDKLLQETKQVINADKSSIKTIYVTSVDTAKLLMGSGVQLYLETGKSCEDLSAEDVGALLTNGK